LQKDISKILLLVLLVNVLIVISAFWIEYFLKIKPCPLCLYQRWIYYLVIFLIIIFLLFNFKKKEVFIILLSLSLINFVFSGYHLGVEQGIFDETYGCKTDNFKILDKKTLLEEMKKKEIVSCKDVNFTIFGLSLATINTIISLFFSLIYFKIYSWIKKTS